MAVAHGTQDAGADIVEHQADQAGVVDGQVGSSLRNDFGRHIHQIQHIRDQPNTCKGKEDSQHNRQHDGSMYGILNFFVILVAVILADNNAGTGGEAHEKANEHVDDGANGSYRREGLVADIIAHYPGVHGIVQLLEYISGQQRQCKHDNMFGDATLSHVYVAFFLFYLVMSGHDDCLLHIDAVGCFVDVCFYFIATRDVYQ